MFEKVKSIIIKVITNVDKSKIVPEARIKEDLKADSLSAIELITEIESEFKVELTEDMFESIKTVGDIVSTIEKLKN